MQIKEFVPLLTVEDISKSARFYQDVLGFEMSQKWEPDGKLAWCRIQLDGTALMLQQADAEDGPAKDRGRGVTLYFICDDADAMYERLRSKNWRASKPRDAFYGMRQVYFRDPDGYELCFECPIQKS